MKRITIKDIAKSLDLHHSTVSRALRDDSSINDETKKKVMSYAKKHGYQINRNALQLRGESGNMIGVIVPNIYHSFFSNMISHITDYAFSKGFIVSVFQSNESLSHEKEIIKAIVQNNLSGVIASLSLETTDIKHFVQLQKYGIPLVLFDRVNNDIDVPKVVINNRLAVEQTVNLLAARGCEKIAYLSGISSVMLYRERHEGYEIGLSRNKLEYRNIIESVSGFTIENGMRLTKQLLSGNDIPDAVICDSHLLMQGFYAELRKGEKPTPPLVLATFGGYHGLSSVYPGVIFIQQPENEIAEASFNLLYDCMNNDSSDCNLTHVFEAIIIEN